MLGRTHALIGAIASSWLLTPLVPRELVAPVLVCGALLPDLDSPRSLLTAWQVAGVSPLQPLARVVNRTFGHRGVLHSLLGWSVASLGFIALGALPFWNIVASLALSLGYLSHLAADASTKTGIPFCIRAANATVCFQNRFAFQLVRSPRMCFPLFFCSRSPAA